MNFPYHVSVTYRDGRTWSDDYTDSDDAEFSARNRSRAADVESATVTVTYRDGQASS